VEYNFYRSVKDTGLHWTLAHSLGGNLTSIYALASIVIYIHSQIDEIHSKHCKLIVISHIHINIFFNFIKTS